MPVLRIKLGASVDTSVANSFTVVEKAAVRTAAIIKKQFGDAATEAMRKVAAEASKGAGPYRKTGEEAAGAALKVRKAGTDMTASMGTAAAGIRQKFAGLHNDLMKLPVDLRLVAKEAQKALEQTERARARAALGIGSSSGGGGGGGGGGGSRSIYWHPASWLTIRKPNIRTIDVDPLGAMGRFGMGAAGLAGRSMLGMARAAGVDADWQSVMGKNVNEEKIAQQISSSGYMPGKAGPNGQVVNRQALLNEARQTGMATGTERGELLEGMQAFVGKTGDLQLARDLMGDLAKLSRATGASFADMSNAGAEVANVLGDIPNKAGATEAIMRQIAGQGKLGAVEVRDLATQMAKIATQATKFSGGAAANISLLGIVAQEAKGRGGATNAAQATTAVARFADQLTQSTVLKKMSAAGIDVFADKGHTQLKQAPEVIKAILSYTKGDLGKLSGLMQSSIARKAIGGFAQVYNQTGGSNEDKLAAVSAEFAEYSKQQMTAEEVTRSFSASMETAEAKAKVFNEKMAQVAGQLQTDLMPALVALAPAALSAAKGFGSFITDTVAAIQGKQTAFKGDSDYDPRGSIWGNRGALWESFGRDDREMEAARTSRDSLAAGNDYANIRGWMGHLPSAGNEGASPEQIAAAQAAAAPMIAQLTTDDAKLTMRRGNLGEQIAKEGEWLRGNAGRYGESSDDAGIVRLSHQKGTGGEVAAQYLQDKKQAQALDAQIASLEALKLQLSTVISSGAVIVRVDGGDPLKPPPPGGTQHPNASK